MASALALIAAMALDSPAPLPRALGPQDRAALSAWQAPAQQKSSPDRIRWSTGAQGTFADAPESPSFIGAAVWLDLRDGNDSSWAPSIRLRLHYEVADTVTTPSGDASFQRYSIGLDGCPLRLSAYAMQFSPCVELLAGRLRGEGHHAAWQLVELANHTWCEAASAIPNVVGGGIYTCGISGKVMVLTKTQLLGVYECAVD